MERYKVSKSGVISFTLPFAPSSNHYWGQFRNRRFIKKQGLQFREETDRILKGAPKLVGKMKIEIAVYVPDNRKRDIDNLLKATLDAIEHAELYSNDNLIDDIRIYRAGKVEGGKLEIKLQEI